MSKGKSQNDISNSRANSNTCKSTMVSYWNIDFVGPINPTSSQGNRYILTLSDYFTKFAQAVLLPDKTAAGVAKTLFKVSNIIIIFNALSVFFRFLCK